uniref:AP-3 complex subunit beta-2 n=1 Tax=Myxine glutinosa TaxID=7769 RepID=UPI00358E8B27
MTSSMALNDDKGSGGEPDSGQDPASGGIFSSDFKRHEDLKEMLDGNKDSLKLEAMKRIVAMVARGKNASELFPAVVKNVASKNIELKKLVYVYLVRYAEEQQDLALLSISTFQRALKDPNQLIRASALRVLSSIRVPIIVPIMMLSIKEAASDMSPYVRKTAAHAIPKLFSLDTDQKEQLIEVIEKLLSDKTTLVAGSVVMAFEQVCPERIDLIHKNYRKLCNLLVDVEEWGQVAIINMLTRYARTQFLNPNENEAFLDRDGEKSFYGSDEETNTKEVCQTSCRKAYVMDPDHRLLLRNTKPLLQSCNTAVVMAVAQLYFHLAPRAELGIIAKPLVRLLRSHREVQYVVLHNIATMSIKRRGMFEPYLKSFYIRSTDPTLIKTLKLEILTNLGSETSMSTILREFQTYVRSQDKTFVAATIHAIGRCATNISQITDTCLTGLVGLLSNRDEWVVAESVVVIRKLLQLEPSKHTDIIRHMAKLLDGIAVPMARASILWLIGEYSEHVPKLAPDVLRKAARSFISEEDIVKLQILNLAAKLYLTNSRQTKLLMLYVLNLSKYDQNYDIRDRARFVRQLVVPGEHSNTLSKYAKKIFLAHKPAPIPESQFKDRDQYQLGSLSHLLNMKVPGYQELPDWPEQAPDPSVRNVEVPEWIKPAGKEKKKDRKDKSFYSETDGSEVTESADSSPGSESELESSTGSKESTEISDSDDEEEGEDDDDDEEEDSDEYEEQEEGSEPDWEGATKSQIKKKLASRNKSNLTTKVVEESASDEEDATEGSSSESSESESDSDVPIRSVESQKVSKKSSKVCTPAKQEISLLDLDDFGSVSATTPSPSLVPTTLSMDLQGLNLSVSPTLDMSSPLGDPKRSYPLLHRLAGEGLSADFCFARTQCDLPAGFTALHLTLSNGTDSEVVNVHVGEPTKAGLRIHPFPMQEKLAPGASVGVLMGIDFRDSTQPVTFQLCTQARQFNVSIQPSLGELILPVTMTERDAYTEQGKLSGMNESSVEVTLKADSVALPSLQYRLCSVANLGTVPSSEDCTLRFAGKTASAGCLVLACLKWKSGNADGSKGVLTVNSEKMTLSPILLRELQQSLSLC